MWQCEVCTRVGVLNPNGVEELPIGWQLLEFHALRMSSRRPYGQSQWLLCVMCQEDLNEHLRTLRGLRFERRHMQRRADGMAKEPPLTNEGFEASIAFLKKEIAFLKKEYEEASP